MPYDSNQPKNLAGASRALRTGGEELAEITGEPEEPEQPQADIVADGFRRLFGVTKSAKKFGNPEE